jgi:kynurenine formamidase
VLPGAPSIDQVPLARLAGPASLIDLSDKGPGEAIIAEDLERNGSHVQRDDIVLLRTNWDQKYSFESREYWTQACYVSESACEWLFDCSPSAVGYDFPQDPALRGLGSHTGEPSSRALKLEGFTTHRLLLARGIYNIEYLANLHEISTSRFYVFAMPLRLEGAEAAPARVVAVEF